MSQFSEKLAFIDKNKMTGQFIFAVTLFLQVTISYASTNQPPKATWYRYYDNKGVANISTNVTPTISAMAMKHLTRICRSLNVHVLIMSIKILNRHRNVPSRLSALQKIKTETCLYQ